MDVDSYNRKYTIHSPRKKKRKKEKSGLKKSRQSQRALISNYSLFMNIQNNDVIQFHVPPLSCPNGKSPRYA